MLAHINARDAYIFERMQQRYIVRLFYERRTQRPGPRISSEIASTSITNSHLARPDAVPPSGGFSARCPPSCYFGSPESDFLHFDEFLRISMGYTFTMLSLVELDRCRACLRNKSCTHTHALFFFPRFCTTRVPEDGYTTRKHANERCDSPSPSNR
ncbi:hypothetical protein ALC57_06150 [Trachymyrmex cornetzi]|uniref:Uncharacterized protein n=1 Tax=Trachymyrmex cornetzi TaxID=471704 RepID=A0A195E8U8_9HYME|nr:hypothetical protein ALC57_06150 [Trachymyrmex cornetzi]